VAVTAFKALGYQLRWWYCSKYSQLAGIGNLGACVHRLYQNQSEVPTFLKIEFKSVIEAIDVSSTKKHFQHFHAFRHFWLGQSVQECFILYISTK
jgi:hypothetical protein